nr:hypothetical protein [Tanacetum cinerariifolium]
SSSSDEKSEGDFIDYPTSRGDDDADDDGDELLEDDADDDDEEESLDSKEEEEEHLAPTTEPFEEGETAATPPPSIYRVAARIYVRPHIPMPFWESSVAAARKIRSALTVDDSRRAEDRLIRRLRRERRYFRTLSTTYAREIEALQRDVSTLQGQRIDDEDRLTRHVQHEHAQRDAVPEDGDSCS